MRRRSRRIYVFGVGGLESDRAQQEQMTPKLERGLFSGVERSDRMVRARCYAVRPASAPNRAQQEQMTLKLERGLFSGVERSDRSVGSDKKVKVNIKV